MTDQPLDPRLHAYRSDLADIRLEGRVEADRFVEGRPAEVTAPLAPVRRQPSANGALDTEALHGETLLVFDETSDGWSWIQLDADNYVGWVPSETIGEPGPAPTHRVSVPRTLLFPAPDIKRPPLAGLPMGAAVTVRGEAEDHNAAYHQVEPEGAIVQQHLERVGTPSPDYASIAEQFLGVPYLWGGKSTLGIDCSGLVQLACQMAGIPAPRDTDMQERELGTRLAGVEAMERGDLIFWKGHVGIMLDGNRLLHANAHHMMTAIEPIAAAIERIEKRGSPVTSVRRITR